MKDQFLRYSIILLIFCVNTTAMLAQCPMCKAAAESNLKEGGSAAAGLNAGIFYLFFSPFVLIGSLALIWIFLNRGEKLKRNLDPRS